MLMVSRIYTRFLEHCRGVNVDSRWQFLQPDQDSRLVEGDLSPALTSLRREFGTEDLLKAGILVRNNDQHNLNTKLTTEDRILIVLRDSQRKPFDILTSAGTLQRRVPILAVQHDIHTQRGLAATDRRLFVTSSIEDSVLVRSLGLSAVPATCMDHLQGANFRKLLAMTDGFSDRSDFFHAVLVGCNLTEGICEIPANVAAVARDFGQAKRYLKMPRLAVSLWWPSDEEMNNLDYRRRVGNVAGICELLKRVKLLHDIEEFSDPSKSPSREPTYGKALQNLLTAQEKKRRMIRDPFQATTVRDAQEAHEQQVDRAILDPLVDSAMASGDLSVRALRLGIAHESRILHRMLPEVHDAQAKNAETGDGDQINFLSDPDWKRFEASMNMTVRLVMAEARLRKINRS